MSKKYITFLTPAKQQVVINSDLVTWLEPSQAISDPSSRTTFYDTSGNLVTCNTPPPSKQLSKMDKTAIFLVGTTDPIVVAMPLFRVANLLDADGDYSLEESIYE